MAEEKKSRLDQTMGTQGTTTPETSADEAPEHRAQAQWSDTVGLTASEMTIPFMTLAHGMSKSVSEEKAKIGEWYIQGHPAYRKVVVVPLKFGESRNYSIEDEKGKLQTACYAPTAPRGETHGIALLPEGPGIFCGDCPMKDWIPTDRVENGRKVNDPPPCKESFDFLVWSETHQSFAKVGFRGSALKSGRLLATLCQTRGLGQFAVELGSVRETKNGFTYPVPEVTVLGGEQYAEIVELAQGMKQALTAGS